MKDNVRASLYEGYTEPIRDALWGHIYLTPAISALTESPSFMRLQRIMQLGPALRVYPGATHSRASHSIGVYHLARRLLAHLAEEGADSWLSPVGIKSFLCAALLHDLGHFPFTLSLKELPPEKHEALTGRMILNEPVKSLVSTAGGDPYFAAAIVDDSGRGLEGQGFAGREEGEAELEFYRRLLSGSLDPDKLDYLSRDARYCGVPYGAQDVDFILSRLHPHHERGLDIDSKGIPGLESLLFSKYLMYRSVYWHRSVRSATAMVKKALLGALENGIIAAEELYNLDDQGLFSLVRQRDYPLFALMDSVKAGRLFSIAAEIPFEEKNHKKLLNLSDRLKMEESLAGEFSALLGKILGEDSLIIDLPEPVSFECSLFVTDENCFFSEGSSAFKSSLVDAFVKSLRVIRVFINPAFEEKIQLHREGILQITKKWLQYT
jgi:HD superfamily phosphohydrolase